MTRHMDNGMVAEQALNPALSRRNALMLGGMAAAGALIGALPITGSAAAPTADGRPFEILFTVYPQGTLLDFAGPNEILSRIPNTRVRFASPAGGDVTLERGVVFGRTERLADITGTDLICVPGGPDLTAMTTPAVLGEIRRLSNSAKYVTSVCTGSLILAASGVLKGRRSACHWACLNLLKDYGVIPDPARVVKDGRFMSGGGVTSGIDFGLAVAAELRGATEAQAAQLIVEYNPAPPFRAGHPSVAPREILDIVENRLPGSADGRLRVAM